MSNPFLAAWLEVSAHLPPEWKRERLEESQILFYAGANAVRALSTQAAVIMQDMQFLEFEKTLDDEIHDFLSLKYLGTFPNTGAKQ